MSQRSLILPNSAMSDVLNNVERRLAALESRVRYITPIQFEQVEFNSVFPSGDPILVQLDVDPGTWLVLGFINIVDDSTILSWTLQIEGDPPAQTEGTVMAPLPTPAPRSVTMGQKFTFTPNSEPTLKLRADGNAVDTGQLASVTAALMAIPS